MASSEATQSQRGVKLFGVFLREEEKIAAAEKEQEMKPEKKKGKGVIGRAPEEQELPIEYREKVASIGGEGLTRIMGKIVTPSDLGKQQNRLSMPRGQIKTPFLTPKEEVLVSRKKRTAGGRECYEGLNVTLLDPSLTERHMVLACWNSNSNKDDKDDKDDNGADQADKKRNNNQSWWLVLRNKWANIAAENKLQEGEAIQIWSFRFKADHRLGFVVHKVQPPPPPPTQQDHHERKRKRNNTVATPSHACNCNHS